MSAEQKHSSEGIQLYIGASGQPVSVPADGPVAHIYKDYVIKQNLILQEENKTLAAESRDLNNQIAELEEEGDKHSAQTRRLKQYVSNFHSLSEIYKSIAYKDRAYINATLRQEAPVKLGAFGAPIAPPGGLGAIASPSPGGPWISPSYLFMFVIVLSMFMQFYIAMLNIPLTIMVLSVYYCYIHPTVAAGHLAERQARELVALRAKLSDHIEGMAALVEYRKGHKADLDGLTKTMDLIGGFIDNAL